MKTLKKALSILMVLSMLMLPLAFQSPALAATANPSPASPGYMILPFHLTGALTAGSITSVIQFKMPWPAKLVGVSAVCRAHTGAQTVQVLNAGTTMLSSVITLTTAGVVYEGPWASL